MESELKQKKLELLRKELAKKKLKLKKQECRKSAKDHVRQKIKEQTTLYSLPGDGSLGFSAASNASIVIGSADSSPGISTDEPSSLVENPRKCVSFKLTPIHVSSSTGDAIDEPVVGCVMNSNIIQLDNVVHSDFVEQETLVNAGLPLIGDLVTLDSVNCDPVVTSEVNRCGYADPICPEVSCVPASSPVNTIPLLNPSIRQNDSAESDSTLEAERSEARDFSNGCEHSEEMFAPEDVKPCKTLQQHPDYGLGSEDETRTERQDNESNDGTLAIEVTSGLNFSADHGEKFAEKVDCILKENGTYQFNDLRGTASNLKYKIPDLASEAGDKRVECAELETLSDSGNSKLQKQPESIKEINVHTSVQSDSMAPDNLSNQLQNNLPTSASRIGSQQTDLAYCLASEQAIDLNSDNFSASDLSFLDDDNDDLYSRVKARRRRANAKCSSADQNPVGQMQTRTSVEHKLLTEVDDELTMQCEAETTRGSCIKFVTQRDGKHYKKDLENNSMSQSSMDLRDNSARELSLNLKSNMTRQPAFTEYSGNLPALHICETVSNDYLAGCSKQFGMEKGSECGKTSLEEINSERLSAFTVSSENSMGVSSWETNVHEESSENSCMQKGRRKRDKNSAENGSVKRSSFTDNSLADSSTDLSSTSRKRVRRSGRLKERENSQQRDRCSSREICLSLPDADPIRHAIEVVRHSVMDKSQFSEEFSLPDVEYHGRKNVKVNSLFTEQSSLSSQTIENSIQSSARHLLEADDTKICLSTVGSVNERDESGKRSLENEMQVVAEMGLDIDAIQTNAFISTTTDSSQVIEVAHEELLNHECMTGHHGTSEKLSNEQPEADCLYTDSIQLLDERNWNIKIEEELLLQSSFEGSTISADHWSFGGFRNIPVIVCCHGNGITMYRKETEKSEWSVWFTWQADAGRSVISAWPLHHSSICSLLLMSGSPQETCVEILVFDSTKVQRRLSVTRLAADEQIQVCVLTERSFCIGTLCSDESNEWEVMAYSLNADYFAVMPGLTLEGRISHLMCLAVIPEEGCVCAFASCEVVIWHSATGSVLQKIPLNLCVSNCPCVFHENGLLFLPCLLINNNGCLVVLNPLSTKTFILLEYKSPPNDLKQACRFTSSGVGDEFLFAVTDDGTLLLWSLFSGGLVARSSGVHVKSATLLSQNTLAIIITNRIITIRLSLSKIQSVTCESLLLFP